MVAYWSKSPHICLWSVRRCGSGHYIRPQSNDTRNHVQYYRNVLSTSHIHIRTPIAYPTMEEVPVTIPPDSTVLEYFISGTGPILLPARCVHCRQSLTATDHVAWAYCKHNIHLRCAREYFDVIPTQSKACPAAHENCFWQVLPPPVGLKIVDVQSPMDGACCVICNPQGELEYGEFVEFGCIGRHRYHIDCMQEFFVSWKTRYDLDPKRMQTWRNIPCPQCRMSDTSSTRMTNRALILVRILGTKVDIVEIEDLLVYTQVVPNTPVPQVIQVTDMQPPPSDTNTAQRDREDTEDAAAHLRAVGLQAAWISIDPAYEQVKTFARGVHNGAPGQILFTAEVLKKHYPVSHPLSTRIRISYHSLDQCSGLCTSHLQARCRLR
jgi:hypothetical protein